MGFGRAARLSAVLLLAASGTDVSGSAVPIPPAADLLKTLRPGHPRLLMSSADFASLKDRIAADATLVEWKKKIDRDAAKILGQSPSKYEIPDGKRLLAVSRRVVDRMLTLGLAYRLGGERALADRAWKELEAAGNFKDWNPSHFLDTAEMTFGFAIGYDWFHDVWTEEQRAFLRRAMVEKGMRPALKYNSDGKRSWWAACRHNWNQVCNGGIGMGALALADAEPDLASVFLHDAMESIQLAMTEFGPDGAWPEGPGYWAYATMYNVIFLAGLQSALGTDSGLSRIPGFSEAGRFAIHVTGPSGHTHNYADAHAGRMRSPQFFWMAKQFGRRSYYDFQSQNAAPDPLDLVYRPAAPPPGTAAAEPTAAYFRHTEVAFMRGAWNDRNATWVGFKAGDNKANHSHLDLGSFVIEALGRRWAVDRAGDDYNLPGYFGKQRWTYYRLRAEGHSTLVFNPGSGPDQDPAAVAPIVKFASKPGFAFAIADLTPAYRRDAGRVHRGVALLNGTHVLVQDEWSLKQPGEAWWFLHTDLKPETGRDGTTAVLPDKGRRLVARILSPPGAAFTVRPPEPLPSSPRPDKQARNKGSVLCIQMKNTKDARLSVLLTPLKDGESEPAAAVRAPPLDAW